MYGKLFNYVRGLIAYLKFLKKQKGSEYVKMSYKELLYLSFFSAKKFLYFKNEIIRLNKKRIRERKKCKVGFVVYTTSMWSIDGLYRIMESEAQYEPSVIVVPFSDASAGTYETTKKYFKEKGYCLNTIDDASFNINAYDIIIYTNPYVAIDKYINILNLRLEKLVTYVSYSYILSGKLEKLDLPVYFLSWKFFCDSEFYKKYVETKSRIYSNNAVFCGYPKMDDYFSTEENNSHQYDSRKIIMYAPHQSVNRNDVRAATFDLNGWYMLYLAEKYKGKIYWIVKPHPLLRSHSVEAGLFKEETAYDDYLKKWKETGAAKVLENGDYFNLFKESDAMVTDSISFLAEYQFTGKPLLLLESGKQKYNEFGNSIREILYRCNGNDFVAIEQFLKDVSEGKDPMKSTREFFFKANLSYRNDTRISACENVYEIFKNEIL